MSSDAVCPSCGRIVCDTAIECARRLVMGRAVRHALEKINANIAAMYTDGQLTADDAASVDRFIASLAGSDEAK